MESLTARQQQIVDFIAARVAATGFTPSVREIAAHLGVNQPNGVAEHLARLKKKGALDAFGGSLTALNKQDSHLPLAERFERRVTKGDGCWTWTGGTNSGGYGVLAVDGKRVYAHRIAWQLGAGAPPPADLIVCHRCDNPRCVRFDHLFLGTVADNVADRQAKGRSSHGASHAASRSYASAAQQEG